MTISRGPYVNPEENTVYLPTFCWKWNEARHEAAAMAQQEMGGWGRSRYLGKQQVPLHDHEDWEECLECPEYLVYAFKTYEGTYRDR